MCCIFTCCGWMIDLIQRLWTFTMSCCIMSAVGCVMVTTSMGGIALGYNYSLAEYIDLKETNVSIYLKRGVFDDEVADDMEWRRAGHMPVAGHLNEDNLRTGPPADEDSTSIRSGRRLDDSLSDGDDQNKFEGSLMRLTAKPVFQDTPKPHITEDLEMSALVTKHPLGSLDQMKAIQSLIDSRRAMGSGVTTFSPLATYAGVEALLPYLPVNNPNLPMDRETHYRRMMAAPGPEDTGLPPMNPARLAVPDPAALQSQFNWGAVKNPAVFADPMKLQDFYLSSPTYPTPITVFSGIIRPKQTTDHNPFQPDVVTFSLNTQYFRRFLTTAVTKAPVMQEEMDKQPETYKEKISNDLTSKGDDVKPSKIGGKPTEEEYEDEIKGLPVRKRRSIRNPSEGNIIHPVSNGRSANDGTLSSPKNIFNFNIQTTSYGMVRNTGNGFTTVDNQTMVEEINDPQIAIQISNENNTNQQMNINAKQKSDSDNKIDIIPKLYLNENKKDKSLFERLVTFIKTKADSLKQSVGLNADTITKASLVTAKNKIKTRRKPFESKIVSSKYIPNYVGKRLSEASQLSNQEILDSVSVNLNEANLLHNSSSSFLKLLHATLTA